MKKILVVFTGPMDLGGIERSLLGLLDAIDYSKYEVDLFLYAHHGPLFRLINPNVNILPEVKELAYLRESFGKKLRHGCWYSAVLRLRDGLVAKLHPIDYDRTWAKIMRRCAPRLEKHYDLAIGFFRPFDYLVEKADASVKMGWIHTDYSSAEVDLESVQRDFVKVNNIVGVSDECSNTFREKFPQIADRVSTIENILSESYIVDQSNQIDVTAEMPKDSINLLTVGRFSHPKRQDEIPAICRTIRESGLDVKWYLVGFGAMENMIRQRIAEEGMQEHVIILGKKENPYPYIKACDVYVQPSRYEGKCVAVREAQILHKPVVITNYATAGSQLRDGIDGLIVPMDIEGCAQGIASLIRDKDLQRRFIENTKKNDYTNAAEIRKIYQMME